MKPQTGKDRPRFKSSNEVLEALRQKYPKDAYAFMTEVGNSTGFRCNRHADAIVMSLWPSRGLEIIGFEVKVSRGDWVRELSLPEKAEVIYSKCDRWFVAVGDENIVQDGELPPTWGLMVPDKNGGLRVKVPAPLKEPAPEPDRAFLAAILRQCCLQLTEEAVLKAEYQKGFHAGRVETEKNNGWKSACEDLRKKIAAFEKASGVDLTFGWHKPEQIGLAVKQVLNGEVNRAQESLEHLHSQALRIANDIENALGKDLSC